MIVDDEEVYVISGGGKPQNDFMDNLLGNRLILLYIDWQLGANSFDEDEVTFATVTFRAKSGIAPGNSNFVLNVDKDQIADKNNQGGFSVTYTSVVTVTMAEGEFVCNHTVDTYQKNQAKNRARNPLAA